MICYSVTHSEEKIAQKMEMRKMQDRIVPEQCFDLICILHDS